MSRQWRTFLLILCVLVPSSASATTRERLSDTEPQTIPLPQNINRVGGFAIGDLGTDGVAEYVVSAGATREPRVSIQRADGSEIRSFLAYSSTYDRGVTLALGDVDGDRVQEIVTGTLYGGGPHVRVFRADGTLLAEWFAYAAEFRGGVHVATADIDGDGRDEVITAAGPDGGPHVRVFTGTGTLITELFAFDATDVSGVHVTRMDQNQDGRDELVVTHASRSTPELRTITFTETLHAVLGAPFVVPDPTITFGLSVFPINDTTIGLATNGNDPLRVARMDANHVFSFLPTPASTHRALAAHDGTDVHLIQTTPVQIPTLEKEIRVNLTEQRLYAYERGLLQQTFLISAAKRPWKTPTGTFAVRRKLRWHDYRWFYGEGDARNYNIPNVAFNLEFTPHYYIHYAYWHSNWGRPMSHGCVNAPYDGMEWLYAWSTVGTRVVVE